MRKAFITTAIFSLVFYVSVQVSAKINEGTVNQQESEAEVLADEDLTEQTDQQIEKQTADAGEERLTSWEADSNTIWSMIAGLRNIEKENPNDSTLQKEEKREWRHYLYDEELNRIKNKYYNKPFSLKAVMVKDVKLEIKLNKEGQKRLKKVEAAIKAGQAGCDYMAVQFEKEKYKYEVQTGFYEVRFTIPVPGPDGYSIYNTGIKKFDSTDSNSSVTQDHFNVTIIMIVKSQKKALSFSKEDVVPITGKITEIKHGFSFMDEYVMIRLTD